MDKSQSILKVIRGSPKIPAPSQTVERILALSNRPDCDLNKIAELSGRDAGLTGVLLRQANSAFMGAAKATSSVKDACVRLGLKRVRAAVINQHIVSGLGKACPPGFNPSRYWQGALAASVAAHDLCRKLIPQYAEDAGTAGLLCDIGVGLLAYGVPGIYRSVLELVGEFATTDLDRIERETIGITHCQVGAAVLEDWKLDPMIVEAVRRHHEDPLQPQSAGGGESKPPSPFARVVAAGVTCSGIALQGSEMSAVNRLFAQIDGLAADADRLVSELLDELVTHIQETASTLSVELGPVDEMADNFSGVVRNLPSVSKNMTFKAMDRHLFE